MGETMADQDYNHTAELIKAAIPYVDSNWKGPAELIAKLLDLLGSFKSIGNNGTLSASSFRDFKIDKIDIEGLLKGIRPICNNKEQEIVDRILNIFNMKRMFEMYNNMMSAMKTMQDFGGFNFDGSGSGNDSDNVTSNFTGSNFDSIFQSFSNAFSSNNTSGASDNNQNFADDNQNTSDNNQNSSESNQTTSDFNQNSSESKQTTSDFNQNSSVFNQNAWGFNQSSSEFNQTIPDFNQRSSESNQTTSDSNNFTSFYNPFETSGSNNTERAKVAETNENNAFESVDSKNSMNTPVKAESNQNPMNNKMFDMLKAMVPPEQMSTFENLSMLLGSMSYDNNKPDEKKE